MRTVEKTILEKINIDFGNNVFLSYTTENGVLKSYNFKNKNHRLYYILDEHIDALTNSHWSEHHEIIQKNLNILTIDELEKFQKFENLFYIGCGLDGMVRDFKGNVVSSIIRFDDIFSQIYLKIETSKQECEDILNSLNVEYIKSSKIVEIPYYNQNKNKKEHCTIVLDVLIPDKILRNFLKIEKTDYINDSVKKKICYELLKLKKED